MTTDATKTKKNRGKASAVSWIKQQHKAAADKDFTGFMPRGRSLTTFHCMHCERIID